MGKNKQNTPHPVDIEQVAGNGLLDRRLFLKRGLSLGAISGFGTILPSAYAQSGDANGYTRSSWMLEPGKPFSAYGQPSEHESDVIRWSSTNQAVRGNGASWSPLHQLEGTITPNGLHYERHHNGVPQIEPEKHQLLIHGKVTNPSFFSVENLLRYPMYSRICFLECGGNSNAGWNKKPSESVAGSIHGLVSCSEWTGIPLATILEEVGTDKKAKWLIAEGADAFAMNISIPIEKAYDDAMLALYQNGERLRPENGYPMRLILPGWEGVLNVKWLRRMEITSQPVMARNETSKYTELQPSGETLMFTLVMDAKSLITSPSSGNIIPGPGLYQIKGLAWSGRGKIKKAEVSADGGKTWAEAHLDEPVLPKSFTRFRMPWRWDGGPAILKSRAVDETGYTQPERNVLIAQRGRNGYFHYNAVVTWAVDKDGFVSHVYDGNETSPDSTDTPGIDAGWG
jgi:sulfane dehydrogenase subunit SoxC